MGGACAPHKRHPHEGRITHRFQAWRLELPSSASPCRLRAAHRSAKGRSEREEEARFRVARAICEHSHLLREIDLSILFLLGRRHRDAERIRENDEILTRSYPILIRISAQNRHQTVTMRGIVIPRSLRRSLGSGTFSNSAAPAGIRTGRLSVLRSLRPSSDVEPFSPVEEDGNHSDGSHEDSLSNGLPYSAHMEDDLLPDGEEVGLATCLLSMRATQWRDDPSCLL